jgi:hypothetical protein
MSKATRVSRERFKAFVSADEALSRKSDPLEDTWDEADTDRAPPWTPTADDAHAAYAPSKGVVDDVERRSRRPYTPPTIASLRPPPVPVEFLPFYRRWWRAIWR